MEARPARRLFVDPGALQRDRLALSPEDAARARWLGIRAGDRIVVLDGSGWSWTVEVESCDAEGCLGHVTGRSLAVERRTKVTLYQGLLHPYDYRRLLVSATGAGVVAFVPVIADGSPVSALGQFGPEDTAAWSRLVRDAAEATGRGRRPSVSAPMLLDNAFDDPGRSGLALALDASGAALQVVLRQRPFSIDLFCPPAGGFSPPELERMRGRGAVAASPPEALPDPVMTTLATLARLFDLLEASPAAPQSPGL